MALKKNNKERRKITGINLLQISTIAFFLILMEYVVRSGKISQIFLASPSQIWKEFLYMNSHNLLWEHVIISVEEFLVGYSLSAIFGIALGLIFVMFPKVEEFLSSFCSAFMSIPKSAILPLLIIWFGIGFDSKVILIIMFCMFTILFNTTSGAKQTRVEHLKVASVFKATRMQTLIHVIIPSALPNIFTGLRISAATAFTSVIFAEMTAARKGIGFLLSASQQVFNTPRLFVILVVVTIISVILVQMVNVTEFMVCHKWRKI